MNNIISTLFWGCYWPFGYIYIFLLLLGKIKSIVTLWHIITLFHNGVEVIKCNWRVKIALLPRKTNSNIYTTRWGINSSQFKIKDYIGTHHNSNQVYYENVVWFCCNHRLSHVKSLLVVGSCKHIVFTPIIMYHLKKKNCGKKRCLLEKRKGRK
jgi:hypothetical protein